MIMTTLYQLYTTSSQLPQVFDKLTKIWQTDDKLLLIGETVHLNQVIANLLKQYQLHGDLLLLSTDIERFQITVTQENVIDNQQWLYLSQQHRVVTLSFGY